MRVAVLGTGRMGAFRAAWLRGRPDVSEVLVASGDPARGLPLDEVLGAEPDAVVISSATPDHADHVAACAERGLPVLCEKPLALTLRDSRRTIDAADRAGTLLQVSFQRRFDAGFRAARQIVAEGSLGTLYCARFASYDPEPPPEHFIPGSGGIFRDLLVHDFDSARWLTGLEVESVVAVGSIRRWRRFEQHGDVDTAAALLTLEGGVPVQVTGTRHQPYGLDVRAELLGSEDSIAVGLGPRTPLRSVEPGAEPPAGRPHRDFLERYGPAYEAELDAFLAVVRGERENPCPGREAHEALRIAVACERSRAEGRAVRPDEVDDGD